MAVESKSKEIAPVRVVITGSERRQSLEQKHTVRTGPATSSEESRLTKQGFEPGSALYEAELAAQRQREAMGLSPVPEAYKAVAGRGNPDSNLAAMRALKQSTTGSQLASQLASILSNSRNKVFR